ncbi:MAG: S8 family peptidase [Phycisphaerales bacterium]|nr:S8 family peptidase [Phycisphaerales bacterium]
MTTVMLAFAFIPSTPRIARADGPIIDADVQRLMDEKPDEEHALIVSVELCRTPLSLVELLPTPEETNECTRLWRAWETLSEEFEQGCNENLTKEHVDAAYAEAKAYDDEIVAIQKAAYKTYHEDYATIVAESVPDVYENLRSVLGDKIRRVSESSKLLAVRANRETLAAISETPSLKRISFNVPMVPMLGNSRLNIRADEVQCPNGGTAYTGAGVKVAIVDDGIDYSHPRLPAVGANNDMDFTTEDEECQGAGNHCTFGHGTAIAGILFCQPDEDPCGEDGDGLVGIAYDATVVNAKVATGAWPICRTGVCPPAQGCESTGETWSLTMAAFTWAVLPSMSEVRPLADVVSYSRGPSYGEPDTESDTNADNLASHNIDWIVYASGTLLAHSCGNYGAPDQNHLGTIATPSGGYNVVSVANYDDDDQENRSYAFMEATSSWGWTDDLRRKPDLCAPGTAIVTTNSRWDCPNEPDFLGQTGTSFAAPHVAGTVALLLEARPSLTPTAVHAILINSSSFMENLSQSTWHRQAGWGMLDARNAVNQRNYTKSGTVVDDDDSETYYLSTVPAGEGLVITGVWHRAMSDEDSPMEDETSNPAPANLDLILESKEGAAAWQVVDRTEEGPDYDGDDGYPEDNVRQVRGTQNESGQPQLLFRIRVENNPTDDVPYTGSQGFSLASSHGFAPS